ncbi:MAG: GNAT family N-acetyltransferase [Pseudomonadales bacterium]
MRINELDIDQSWVDRLGIPQPSEKLVFTGCDYYQRGGDEDLAFMYSSATLTLISCHNDFREHFVRAGAGSLDEYVRAHPNEPLELYIDDLDFYPHEPVFYEPQGLRVSELEIGKDRKLVERFIASCPGEDIYKADFNLDSDFFYVASVGNQLAGALASYCGLEPFESLSIVVHPDYRQMKVGKALLSHLIRATEQRGRLTRYRTNVENYPSIRLCESLGFRMHSKIQVLARLDK